MSLSGNEDKLSCIISNMIDTNGLIHTKQNIEKIIAKEEFKREKYNNLLNKFPMYKDILNNCILITKKYNESSISFTDTYISFNNCLYEFKYISYSTNNQFILDNNNNTFICIHHGDKIIDSKDINDLFGEYLFDVMEEIEAYGTTILEFFQFLCYLLDYKISEYELNVLKRKDEYKNLFNEVLEKHEYSVDNNTNILPLKKQKLSSSIINRSNYSHASLICFDYNSCYGDFSITLSVTHDNNVYYVGYSNSSSRGNERNKIIPNKHIQGLTNIKQIDCGWFNVVCLNFDGEVFSFGSNEYGQLGIGKDEYEVKEAYIPQKINIPSCKQVSCGYHFTVCLTEDNQLYSFGENGNGELGLRNNNNYSSPQLIPDFNNIEFIVCGASHIICKTYNNEFYSWGYNYYGQLGQGNNESCNNPIQCLNWPDNIISIKCGYNYSLLLTLEGQIYSFGDNRSAQLGINDKNIQSINIPTLIKDIPEIQRIECGLNHSMCIDINNYLWIFGDNYSGQLGLGDTENRYKPVIHPTLSNIIDISSRGNHTFVKTIDNKIYAFGYNNYYQLGIKTSEKYQLTPIQVFQDNEDIWCSTIGKSKQKSARK